MRLALLLVAVLCACEEGPAYESQRCKELRAKIRAVDALRRMRSADPLVAGLFPTNDIDAKRRELIEENPECFDPSL